MEMTSRYLTLMLGAVQAYGIIRTMQTSDAITFTTASHEWLTYIYIIVIMMAGSRIVMWLGDQISVKGIGNGISMIIFAGIVCSLPSQIGNAFTLWVGNSALQGQGDSARIAGIFKFLLYILSYVLIISFVTFIELSKRKIPVQHSGKGGGQTQAMSRASFLPIKVNSAGVIPVIFASSILMAPSIIVAFVDAEHSGDKWLEIFQTSTMYDMGGWSMPWGLIIYLVLTIAFTFFYANVQINPQQLAENFQKNGSYIPGIHTGNETERYVRKVLNRVTFIGAMALALIAALPVVLTLTIFKDNPSLALGGTGLIIVVGVALEINSQIDGLLAGKSFEEVVASGGR